MFERSLNPNDIINLLSRLKAKTPDYPLEMKVARKTAFMKQVVAINISGPSLGGKGGGDGGSGLSGGSGGPGALGGMSTAQGILLQAVVGVWIIAGMLTAAYVFRGQIIDLLQDNGIVSVEMTQAPSIDSPAPVMEIPSLEVPPTEITPPSGTAVPESVSEGEIAPEASSDTQDTSDTSVDNNDKPGLHLGQTPGAPDTPNQDNPNKPDKPKKQDKSK
ncbi:MAG: hypothetical protein WBL25_15205 [Anaerolineales bacterium]